MFRSILSLALVASVMLVTPVSADPHPKGFIPNNFNGSTKPITEDGVTTFHIEDRECSTVDYGDGRGESDCLNGNVRSELVQDPWVKLGRTVEYRFDLQVDPSLQYEGYFNHDSAGFEPDSWDSHVRLATWQGTFLHNFIYILKASTRTGVTFNGEQCQAPQDLGEWVTFSMKVKWTGDDKGWIDVTCNGRHVYVDEDAATNVAPDCYVQNECVPREVRSPKQIQFAAGVQMSGWGGGWEGMGKDSQFIPLPDGGITVRMRGLAMGTDPVLYGPEDKALVVKLQEALNALGCDVGAADGAPGKRTKTAALICRKFADGAMPAELNVASLQTFVDLYTSDGVADLPPGELPPEPLAIHAFQQGSETSGTDTSVVADFGGNVTGDPSGVTDLNFLLTGEFDYGAKRMEWLSLLMLDDLEGNRAAQDCEGVRIEDWGDNGSHAVIEFEAMGTFYLARDMDCVADKLPGEIGREAVFIVDHFAELAASLVADGTITGVSNDGLRLALQDAAAGKVVVERAAR